MEGLVDDFEPGEARFEDFVGGGRVGIVESGGGEGVIDVWCWRVWVEKSAGPSGEL